MNNNRGDLFNVINVKISEISNKNVVSRVRSKAEYFIKSIELQLQSILFVLVSDLLGLYIFRADIFLVIVAEIVRVRLSPSKKFSQHESHAGLD